MTCTPAAPQQKFVRSAFDAAYRRAWHRQHSRAGQQMRRVRQRMVGPVFGSLLHHYGLRRVGTKGLAAAPKAMLLSAIAYNLKKLLKYQPKCQMSLAMALPKSLLAANRRAGWRKQRAQVPTWARAKLLSRNAAL